MELSDYRQRDGRLYVRRLGSKSGKYALFDEERRALNVWLKKRRTLAGPLFPSRRHCRISRWALDELMKKYCRLAGVPEEKPTCMHSNTAPERTPALVQATWPQSRIIWDIT